jgi:hypothetical protein
VIVIQDVDYQLAGIIPVGHSRRVYELVFKHSDTLQLSLPYSSGLDPSVDYYLAGSCSLSPCRDNTGIGYGAFTQKHSDTLTNVLVRSRYDSIL